MVRISDILKQQGSFPEPAPRKDEKPQEREEQEAQAPPQQKQGEEAGIEFSKAVAKEPSEDGNQMQLVKAMHQMQLDPVDSDKIYKKGLKIIEYILAQIKSDSSLDLRDAYEIVKTLVDRIVLGDKELLALINSSSTDNYLYAHSLNVCILAIELGLGLGFNKSKLNELGLGAFLHDVGMVKVMDIANLPRRLSEFELKEIKRHPVYSTDILNTVKDIQEGVLMICGQTHERLDGTGYPKGLHIEHIHEYAKITAVVDVYEALIHPRSHRKAMMPHDALKELLSIGSEVSLEASIIKMLINKIGLYPIGSWVELSSGEIGRVVASCEDSPLRPRVNVIFGADREKLAQMKSIDLSSHSNIYIKHSVNPQDLSLNL